MDFLRARLTTVVLALVLAFPGVAWAGGATIMDDPRSGIRLEVEGACIARPADAGAQPACPEYATKSASSEVTAIVPGVDNAPPLAILIAVRRETGVGERRARRLAASEQAVPSLEEPTIVTHGGIQFARSRSRSDEGTSVLYVTVDDRPEVAIVAFATATDALPLVEAAAERAMATVRRSTPAADVPMSCGSQALISAAIIVFVGLPVFGLIFRAIRIARRFEKKDVHVDDSRRAREAGAQLAGEKCVGCKKNIVVEREAMACRACRAPVHVDCVARHSAEKHA